jgi:EAL domain-containing protein (putative c-di-GMP-specific phosphodiesterase class I)
MSRDGNSQLQTRHPGSRPPWIHDPASRSDWFAVEITETAIMIDTMRATEVLMHLHELGIKISIDDFGVGYSSLSYLCRLPVDRLKIDRSFVMNMTKNPSDAMIVRSTIDLAHNLGLEVVAEGVELEEQYAQLQSWGCDAAQGYFMSRPLPAEDLAKWLQTSVWGIGRRAPSSQRPRHCDGQTANRPRTS